MTLYEWFLFGSGCYLMGIAMIVHVNNWQSFLAVKVASTVIGIPLMLPWAARVAEMVNGNG